MDQVLEKTILVVVTVILRIHVGEIVVKVVRFYLLLSLHFLLQIGFIPLHRLSEDLILSKAM